MDYPVVRHAHVVPAGYLANFADERRMLMMRLKRRHLERCISVRDAAVRTDFYRRTRPDGSATYDIEWSLGQLENVTLPRLRQAPDVWPLEMDDKGLLTGLFAYQLVRGPRWRAWHETFIRTEMETHRQLLRADGLTEQEIAAQLDATERHLLSDTPRHIRMMSLAPGIGSILGSMNWTLVEFARPLLVTSDHPVVVWPLNARSRAPEESSLDTGLFDVLEVRVPISSRHAILMTWRDEADGEPMRGQRHHAGNLNAFTVANAERQWFHLPGASPPCATGRLLPLSAELVPGYGTATVQASLTRAAVRPSVQERLGQSNNLDQSFQIFTVNR